MEKDCLKQPGFTMRLDKAYFQNELCCLGKQLAQILSCIKKETVQLTWYAFDVYGSSDRPISSLFENPISVIGNTDLLIEKVKDVVQFHSGVFIGIPSNIKVNWVNNYLPETEEAEGLQHQYAEIEIRPFDASYFEVYGMDKAIEKKILGS